MKKLLSIASVVIIIAIVVGGYSYPKSVSKETIVRGITSPDSYYEYTANNDLQKFGGSKGFTPATTTVCAFKSPSATSTLTFGSATFSVASSTATVVTLAKATSAFATTTVLNSGAIAANAQGTLFASSTTVVNVDGLTVFAPNTYFVVGMSGGIGTFSPSGRCSVQFTRN